MAHFAEIDEDNVVQRVIVVSNKNTSDSEGNESEDIGVAFCRTLYGSDTNWKQCSYSLRIRKTFPTTGMIYDSEMDLFHMPQPFPSWVLRSDASWNPPISKPDLSDDQLRLGYFYSWNEDQYQINPENGWGLFTPQIINIESQPSDVSVGVGSTANLNSSFSINEGNFTVSVQYNPDGEGNVWEGTNWSIVESRSESSVDAINSGIITSTSLSGKYRVVGIPEETGIPAISKTITLTVTGD